MRTTRAAVFVALCVGLGACAKQAPPPPAPAPATPEFVDGDYRGTSTRFQADSRTCPHPGVLHFEVIGRMFQYRWAYGTYVDAAIAPDGSVTGGAERITLVGRQTGPKIEGDVTNGDCGLHFTVMRQS